MENSVTAENVPVASLPLVRQLSVRVVVIILFFAALWGMLWRQLSGEWSVNDQYAYGLVDENEINSRFESELPSLIKVKDSK